MDRLHRFTEEDKQLLLSKTSFILPDNPSDKKFSGDQVRRKMYEGFLVLLEFLNSTIDTENRNIDNINLNFIEKLTTKDGIVVIPTSSTNISVYEENQMFFIKDTKTLAYRNSLGTLTTLYDIDQIGLIKRSGAISAQSGLSEAQLEEAKKRYCLMIYTGESQREMYIKVSGVSSSETESSIKFVKIDKEMSTADSGKEFSFKHKSFTFNASTGALSASENITVSAYSKEGANSLFPKKTSGASDETIANNWLFSNAPQTSEEITDASAGTKLATKKYVRDLVNAHLSDYDVLNGKMTAVEGKIPSEATPSNKLADRDFVNSTVNSLVAFYITKNAQGDPFATYAELASASTVYSGGQVRVPTRNDYCLVASDENHQNSSCRYIYQGGQWEFQFVVNETAFTSDQIKAINSGITDILVAQITTNATAITAINSKLPKVKDFVIAVNQWQLDSQTGRYYAEVSAGNDFVINDNAMKTYTGTSASDNNIIGSYGIIASSDATSQKFKFECYRGSTAPSQILNYTIAMYGGN